jgi:hypothetical protein
MTEIRKIVVMAIADGGRLDNRCGTPPSGEANSQRGGEAVR